MNAVPIIFCHPRYNDPVPIHLETSGKEVSRCCSATESSLMNSENNPGLLSFEPVLDLFRAFSLPRDVENNINPEDIPSAPSSCRDDASNGSLKSSHLGDFDDVWRHLGKHPEIGTPKITNDGFDLRPRDVALTPTTSLDHGQVDERDKTDDAQSVENSLKTQDSRREDSAFNSDQYAKTRGGRTTFVESMDDRGSDFSTPKHRPPLVSITKNMSQQVAGVKQTIREDLRRSDDGAFGSEVKLPNISLRQYMTHRLNSVIPNTQISNADILPSPSCLRPAWVTPAIVPDPRFDTPPPPIVPVWLDLSPNRTKNKKAATLISKLSRNFGSEPGYLLTNSPLSSPLRLGGNVNPYGIHVFVDSSNILIGFYNAVKLSRQISPETLTKAIPFSFHSLTLVMERGRPAAKRVLVGSSQGDSFPGYITVAKKCGYEVSVLKRVRKMKVNNQRGSSSHGTSGQSSGSETPYSGYGRVTEQGVDELLHMKMLESIVDYKPSTMVLATGDAAEAEYSGGFLVMVERALSRGWKVELVAWTSSMSNAWVSRSFTEKWRGRFRLVELDDYCEELLEY